MYNIFYVTLLTLITWTAFATESINTDTECNFQNFDAKCHHKRKKKQRPLNELFLSLLETENFSRLLVEYVPNPEEGLQTFKRSGISAPIRFNNYPIQSNVLILTNARFQLNPGRYLIHLETILAERPKTSYTLSILIGGKVIEQKKFSNTEVTVADLEAQTSLLNSKELHVQFKADKGELSVSTATLSVEPLPIGD